MITDSASSTNRPPMMTSTISCLVATATAPSMPPSASEPVSPMKIAAGGALNHRKPRPAPITAPQMHREFAGALDEVDLEVVGEDRVAGEIGDHAEARRRDHHRHDGEPVETVGEVHRVAGADDDEGGERHEEPAEIDDHVLEEGQRQCRRQRRLADPREEDSRRPSRSRTRWRGGPCRRSPCGSAW